MPPLVTIAIPTLNRLSYLKEAVHSALNQDYASIEVVIGDDGEDPELRSWCEALVRQDSRVRYQRNSRRLGLAGNWNAIASNAHGEYVAIIGDDDRLLPAFAKTLSRVMDGGIDVAFSNHYLIDHSGYRLTEQSRQYTRHFRRDSLCPGNLEKPEIQLWENAVPMSASLLRTFAVQSLRFNENLNTPEIEFFLRLAQKGGRFHFVPEYLSEYRMHRNSATASGLWSDKLIEALMPISAAPEIEPYKEHLIAALLFNGINRCLIQGEWERVQTFIRNPYNRCRLRNPKAWLQRACSQLPKGIGWPLYRMVFQLWNFLSRR